MIVFGSSGIPGLAAARMAHLHKGPSERTSVWLMPRLRALQDGALAREDGRSESGERRIAVVELAEFARLYGNGLDF